MTVMSTTGTIATLELDHLCNLHCSVVFPDLVTRITDVHHQYRIASKQHDRLRKKIAAAPVAVGVSLDESAHEDLKAITTSESAKLLEDLPADSFKRIFWEQQLGAACQKNARTMRWHPLMIRWCLYLRHRLVILVIVHGK